MEREQQVVSWYILVWIGLLFGILLLCGCAKHTDPVTTINDDIQQGVAELVDYANNNMEMDADKQLLLSGSKECARKANALTEQHKTEISACEAKIDMAKAERNTLAIILALAVFIKLFNIRL